MLLKLQKKTLVKSQVFAYAITLLIGVTIILVTTQFYFDFKPLLYQQTDVFKGKTAIISKNISAFKSINKERIYFSDKEIIELKEQAFTKDISKFNTARFKIKAFTTKSERVPIFYTDLFFESIHDKYLEVETDEWVWDSSQDFIPIVVPENYLNLYNFGFAESQGLPVLSKNTISHVKFNVRVSGNRKSKDYKSKIVGFSNKINSILVPEAFLEWANAEFGESGKSKASRILIEFTNPADESILKFFNEKNYSINKEKLEFSKLVFFFKSALIFVFFIALVIIILSIGFIILSLNLMIQKNKTVLLNLYDIGFSHKRIARFYQITISLTTVIAIVFAIVISHLIRDYYLRKIVNLFEFKVGTNYISLSGILLLVLLIIAYNLFLVLKIKKVLKG